MYDRAKLKKAVMLAFAKRSVQPDVIDALISNLEVKWQSEGSEVLSTKIWEDILASLREIDPVVYVASVYQSFNSFEDFKQFIE